MIPEEITIRRCTPADAGMLSALAQRTFYDTFTGTCTEADMQHFLQHYYNIDTITRELEDTTQPVFFALQGATPVGYIRFGQNEVPFPHDPALNPLELNRLYIETSFHKQGVAQMLMQVYFDYAAAHSSRLLWLGVWEFNYRAQRFYTKFGFVPNGHTHPFPIGDTPQTDQWWEKVI